MAHIVHSPLILGEFKIISLTGLRFANLYEGATHCHNPSVRLATLYEV